MELRPQPFHPPAGLMEPILRAVCVLGDPQTAPELQTGLIVRTDRDRTTDEHAALLLNLMHHKGIEPESIQGIAVANVVPIWSTTPITPGTKKFGLRIAGL